MIELKHVTKRYGAKCAVNDISFTINKGEVLGFLGAQRCGQEHHDEHDYRLYFRQRGTDPDRRNGYPGAAARGKRRIGYLPELPPLYMDMTVEEYLKFVCEIKEVRRKRARKRIWMIFTTWSRSPMCAIV